MLPKDIFSSVAVVCPGLDNSSDRRRVRSENRQSVTGMLENKESHCGCVLSRALARLHVGEGPLTQVAPLNKHCLCSPERLHGY